MVLDGSEVTCNFGKEWYLPHHPVLNPNKPGKVRRVCKAASNSKEVCLNDNLLAGPDLLHGLIGTIFRFREGPIALTADIESMFLKVKVPEQDRSCLMLLWRPWTNDPVQTYEHQLHVLWATGSPTCVQIMLLNEWDRTTKKSIRLQQRQYKKLLHGRFHSIGRNPWRSNWSVQSTTTSLLTTWIWIGEVDKQEWCSYQSNPRELEIQMIQQYEASRSGTQYGGNNSSRTTMDRYLW